VGAGETVPTHAARVALEAEGRQVQRHDEVGPWLRFAVIVLKPLLTVLTSRRWSGSEHVPSTGGVVLCVNHISHVDPLTFAHFVWDSGRSPRFLAKESLFRVPFVRRVLRGARQIPVYRDSTDAARSLSAAVAAVRAGECVCIYPEGTLTRDPELWPMAGRTGAARVALTTGAPVIPIAQWGAQDMLPPYSRRLRLRPRHPVQVVAGPPVDLRGFAGREPTAADLHDATECIMAAVTGLLAQVREGTPPAHRYDPRLAGVPTTGDPRRTRRKESE
jgi:1-acyl-sn-glycerol-3-phosphate acyltransferase